MGFKPENHDQPSTSNQLSSSPQEFRYKKRKHSTEFKIKAVKLCLEPGASYQKIADSLNLKSALLYGWLKVYRNNNYSFPDNAFCRRKNLQKHLLIIQYRIKPLPKIRQKYSQPTALQILSPSSQVKYCKAIYSVHHAID